MCFSKFVTSKSVFRIVFNLFYSFRIFSIFLGFSLTTLLSLTHCLHSSVLTYHALCILLLCFLLSFLISPSLTHVIFLQPLASNLYSSLHHTACQQHSQLTHTPSATFLLFAPQRASVSAVPRFLANVNSRSRSLYAIARPSVVCLSSVTCVHPTQAVQIFRNISKASIDIH